MATVQLRDQKVLEALPRTVGELLERIEVLLIRKAIYEQLLEHLGSFLSTDSHQPDKGIKAPHGGAIEEDNIATVCEEIEETISTVSDEVDRLKQQGIAPAQDDASGKKQRGKKDGKKQQGKAADEEEGGSGE